MVNKPASFLYSNPQPLINKTHQPGRANHQELDVFEEGGFLSLYFMAVELPDPRQYKYNHTKKP